MRNEASRGWLCLSITSIDFALMPPVKLCRAGKAVIERGKGDGLGCDQSMCPCCTVAIYSYACHLCATTVLGQQRYCVAAIWGQIDALKTPLSTLKYLHLNFTQINSSKGTGVCVCECVRLCSPPSGPVASLFGQQKLIITINWKWQPQPLHNFHFYLCS